MSTTIIFGNQNQSIKLEKSYNTFCQKLKQAFHIDWDISSLQYDKEIKDQISYDEYIKGNKGCPLEINYSFDILRDYIEDAIKEYLDIQYDRLFTSIRDYIKHNFNFEIITQLNKTLNEISIEPIFSKVTTFKLERVNPPMNNNTHSTKNIHQTNISVFQKPTPTPTMNSNTFLISNKDNRRKETNKHTNQTRRTSTGPTRLVITNSDDISPSAFIKEIDKEYKILKKFSEHAILQSYEKNISKQDYLNNLYKNQYITLDAFSFDKL